MGELSANFQTLDVSLKSQIESMKPLIQSPDIYDVNSTGLIVLQQLTRSSFDVPFSLQQLWHH